jgi:hypothetical protein
MARLTGILARVRKLAARRPAARPSTYRPRFETLEHRDAPAAVSGTSPLFAALQQLNASIQASAQALLNPGTHTQNYPHPGRGSSHYHSM